jgi:fructose/tagatose bisphosphate aldolase
MTLVKTRDLLDQAVHAHIGVAAFNVITLEHAEAIAAGAQPAPVPAILQVSQNAVKFHGGAAHSGIPGDPSCGVCGPGPGPCRGHQAAASWVSAP